MIQPFGTIWAAGVALVVAAVRFHVRRARPSTRLALSVHRYQVPLVLAALVGSIAPTLLDASRARSWPIFGVNHATGAIVVALTGAVTGATITRGHARTTLELLDLVALYAPIAYALVALVGINGADGWVIAQAAVEGPLLLCGSVVLWRTTRVQCLFGATAGIHAVVMAISRAFTADHAGEFAAAAGLAGLGCAVVAGALVRYTARARVTALETGATPHVAPPPTALPSESAPSTQPNRPDDSTPS